MKSVESLHVLLAEDGLVNQKVAKGLLNKRGHRVEVVENGKDALVAMESNQFDAVLMDIEMPEMDGVAAVKQLREREALDGGHQWVVAVTGHAMTGDRERFLQNGFDDHLVKPFRPASLYDAVERDAKPSTLTGKRGGKPIQANDSVPSTNEYEGVSQTESGSFMLQTRDVPVELPMASPMLSNEEVAAVTGIDRLAKSISNLEGRSGETFFVLDQAAALEKTAGDSQLAEILLQTCLEEAPKIIKRAEAFIEKNDFDSARGCGHSLRSSFSNVGAIAASGAARFLEFCEPDEAGKFHQAVAKVKAAYDELANAVH